MTLGLFESPMQWPFGPYETVMGAILLMTIPIQRILTRDEPEMRVPLIDLLGEIRSKGYKWHISVFLIMYGFKAFIDQHNEAIKPRVGGFTHAKNGKIDWSAFGMEDIRLLGPGEKMMKR